jgi:hypothetical protein
MLDIGTTGFSLDAPTLSRRELRAYSTQLFDEWEDRLSADFALRDYALRLEIEEGSIEGLAYVGASIAALYSGIATYPSFLQGLEKIRSQVRQAGDYLVQRAATPFTTLGLKPRVSRRTGVPGQLQRLFLRVKRREISVELAMIEAERLLGPEASFEPNFIDELADSFADVETIPEQLLLPMELPPENDRESSRTEATKERQTRTSVTQTPTQQLKVEVWRDTRTGKRKVRVTEL